MGNVELLGQKIKIDRYIRSAFIFSIVKIRQSIKSLFQEKIE